MTVFLSLTLWALTAFILLLTGGAIRNGEKVKLECGLDIAMNATLAEYHIGLLQEYDLLYLDTSYLGMEPCEKNLEARLRYYLEENMNLPWGKATLEEVKLTSIETAAADMGNSVRSQAVTYIYDKQGVEDGAWTILDHREEMDRLEGSKPLADWSDLMKQIAAMELPKQQNRKGIWEEVPLSNPADIVYGLSGSDIFYLAQVDLSGISKVQFSTKELISHRQINNTESLGRQYENDDRAFLSYLFEKMGYYETPNRDLPLACQIEYVAGGYESDIENVRAVGEKLFRWRFADNVSCAFGDDNLQNQAALLADGLLAVQLKEDLREPVIQSILYACAFLESVNDVRILYKEGRVPLRKTKLCISAWQILMGIAYKSDSSGGFSYREYLAGMLLLSGQETVNLRVMDMIEMEMRLRDGNPKFALDWCIERYRVQIRARSGFGDIWYLDRKYGYF